VLHQAAERRVHAGTQSAKEKEMKRYITAAAVAAFLVGGTGLAGCDKGPMQKAGEKVDDITGQDKVIGKGPSEKAGRKIDNTVNDIKK
jgi:hypothetical protein